MSYEPTDRLPIGQTGLRVTRLGFGAASIGGLYREVSAADAATVLEHAWRIGIRYFDTAPLYGYGTSERRVGRLLQSHPRNDFVLSTKVGRLVREAAVLPAGAEIDSQAIDGRPDAFYVGTGSRRIVFDYSFDGVLRSIEESLERLGLARVDIVYIHDPDRHWAAALEGAYPALARLRADGRIGAIGVGMNDAELLTRFASECDLDVVLVANRYTLLDQRGLEALLPTCARRGVAVIVGGVMNTGILANPSPTARFDYVAAPDDVVARAQRIAAICAAHHIPIRSAAIQFPLGHPAVVSVVAGVRSVEHLDDYPAAMRTSIPSELWAELRHEGLLREDAPVPIP